MELKDYLIVMPKIYNYDGHNDSCRCCVIFLQTKTAKNCQILWKCLRNKLCENIMMSKIRVSVDCTF